MDPDLAATAVQACDSSISQKLVPFAVRKEAVLKALQTGLYTLRWLKDWQVNPLGGVRVKAVQRLAESKQTLPLIFPEMDLGYVYREGALHSPELASVKRTKPPGVFEGVRLQAGGRVPHCWMVPLAACATGGSPVPDRTHFAFSTVQLPVVCEQLIKASYADIGHSVPGMVLVVHSKHEAAAAKAVENLHNKFIGTTMVVVVHDKTHREVGQSLQERFQNPRYHLASASPTRPEVLKSELSFAQRLAPVFSGAIDIGHCKSIKGVHMLPVEDAEGTWRERCQDFLATLTYTGPGSHRLQFNAADVAVVLRPDGHVASVFHVLPTEQAGDISHHMYYTATALNIIRPDGFNA